MTPWQPDLLARLAERVPGDVVPYGSVTAPELLDGWSDLDVAVTAREPFELEAVLGAPLWTVQEAADGDTQVLRAVLVDGRRVDLGIRGARARVPEAAADAPIRFEAALAVVRFGRGSDLIGLHLTLGILREALVQSMLAADAATGTAHHRTATEHDARAAEAQAVLAEPLGPRMAMDAYALYGRRRAEIEPGYAADPAPLEAVLRRGAASGSRR
ncbi:hypothetical protein NLU66_16330 [Brachybacterium sp. NBEC-018]|uniref:hypothetical protein n=1 Tax=Brachybacterium sp. NBEC-018 TaxID=2996004 RepID=UPI0021750F95|nr:hypothetical protein [Brachybacterium sp. NBEC-018]UVY83757.1 hypothetical protein NLU66_16330 [Brachybacterium sp. NBEC-018]